MELLEAGFKAEYGVGCECDADMREGICCGWVWEVVGRGMSGRILWVRGGWLEGGIGRRGGGVVWSIGEDCGSGDGVGCGGFLSL